MMLIRGDIAPFGRRTEIHWTGAVKALAKTNDFRLWPLLNEIMT